MLDSRLGQIKGARVSNVASKWFATQDDPLHEARGHILVMQAAVTQKSEAAVILRVAEHDAARVAPKAQLRKPMADKCGAKPLPLSLGLNRKRAKAEPTIILARNADRREGDVSDNGLGYFGNEGQSQIAVVPQCTDDGHLRMVSV